MLLSRVAESVYWAGRYLERAEDTARLVRVHTELYIDLPRSAGVGWLPLLAVTGSRVAFDERATTTELAEEEAIVTFLAVDPDHTGSVLASLAQARANLRVTRAILPRSSWEVLNQLVLWAADTADDAVGRRTRMAWMDQVIRQCQLLSGLLAGQMSHDGAWSFLEIGRCLERADMATRVLDVQAGILLGQGSQTQGQALCGEGGSQQQAAVHPYDDITWMSVLRSLSARQMFRRQWGAGVSGPDALQFLLKDPQFPRSIEHCLTSVSRSLLELPRYDEPMAACAEIQQTLEDLDTASLAASGLHEVMDALQAGIGSVHDLLVATYFDVHARSDARTPTPAAPAA